MDLSGGLFGLTGVLVGGAIAYSTTARSVRSAERQSELQRSHELQQRAFEQRAEGYGTLEAHLWSVLAEAQKTFRKFQWNIEVPAYEEEPMVALQEAMASARIWGSGALREKLDECVKQLLSWFSMVQYCQAAFSVSGSVDSEHFMYASQYLDRLHEIFKEAEEIMTEDLRRDSLGA
jgi:hypothetical protein